MSSNYSGGGFSDMNFKTIAVSWEQFDAWVQKTKQSPQKLDLARFEELAKPSIGYPVVHFSSVKPGLFDHILSKYRPMGVKPSATHGKSGVLGEG